MKRAKLLAGAFLGCAMLLSANSGSAQDWPQWRGPNRDGKAMGFNAPKDWPKELTQKWKVTVGDGVATPALVGDKLYVFSRQEGMEVLRCLNAANGKELWQDKYEAKAPTRPGSGFNNEFVGPRSSPAVAEGKVVALGANGTLSCLDAATGKVVWRKDDFKGSVPRFFTSSSPIIVNGLCIFQVGGEREGAVVAFDVATGNEKWKWSGDGTAYASPVLLTADDKKMLIAETAKKIVGLGIGDGKLLWETSYEAKQMSYNASTPMVEGQTLIYSGGKRGTKAVKIEKKGDDLAAKDVWSNAENSVQFNTPVLKNGLVFGISEGDKLFCINAETGKTAWSSALDAPGGRNRGYGSIVDAGPVLLALNPTGQLIVFEPSDKEFKQIAKYKVASGDTFAYPIVAGNRVFVKDKDSVTLWTIE